MIWQGGRGPQTMSFELDGAKTFFFFAINPAAEQSARALAKAIDAR
jgi:hypothetical protein